MSTFEMISDIAQTASMLLVALLLIRLSNKLDRIEPKDPKP